MVLNSGTWFNTNWENMRQIKRWKPNMKRVRNLQFKMVYFFKYWKSFHSTRIRRKLSIRVMK